MSKRAISALVGVLASVGLALGMFTGSASATGALTMFEQATFLGAAATDLEPGACQNIADLPLTQNPAQIETALSAINGTDVDVEFFSLAGCGDLVETVEARSQDAVFAGGAARSYQAVS